MRLLMEQTVPFRILFHFRLNGFCISFAGQVLRYEILLFLAKGIIIWVHGPFPCGAWPDLKIFQKKLLFNLFEGEKIVDDRSYRQDKFFTPDNVSVYQKPVHAHGLSRIEIFNVQLEYFNILNNIFRHNFAMHWIAFHAVTKLVTLMVRYEEPLFAM